MTSVADLALRPHREIAYLLVIDGLPYMFTDNEDIAGTGVSSWIGTSDRVVHLGLEVPESLEVSTDLDDSNLVSGGGATFTVADFDGETLLALVKEPDTRAIIYERISPKDDPAPNTAIGDGGASVTVWDRYMGAECIGPAGERRRFQCLPNEPMPGLDHAAIDTTVQGHTGVAATTEPEHAADLRRVALYVLYRDVFSPYTGAASWPSWSDQHASGYSLIWWGTLSAVENEGREWKLKCDGPGAWLRRQINANTPDAWRGVSNKLRLNDTAPGREDLIAIAFRLSHYKDSDLNLRCGASAFDPVSDVLTASTVGLLIGEIGARLSALAGTPGLDGTDFQGEGGEYEITSDFIGVRYPDSIPAMGGELWLCMHEKVWRYLGYDPKLQHRTFLEIEEDTHIFFIDHKGAKFTPFPGVNAKVPGPGYYTAVITTLPYQSNYQTASVDCDNGGEWRLARPLYAPGLTMLSPEGGEEIGVAFGIDTPYMEGQLARPPAAFTLESGDDCDTAGFMVFKGQYRESLDSEARELYQVAKVSWKDDANTFSQNNESDRVVLIEKWLDPRLYGYTDPPLDLVWTAERIEWKPIRVLGYNLDSQDHAHMVALRLLLSTGTAYWDPTAFEGDPDAVKTVGLNSHPDAAPPHSEGDDLEIADLGLAIPASMVDWDSFVAAATDLPGGYQGPLNRCKIAISGAQDSDQILTQILQPRGWAMGLHGFRYGLFNVGKLLTADDAQVSISESDLASDEYPHVPGVNLYPLAPFDKASIEFGYPAAGEGGDPQTIERGSLSPRTRGRHGNASRELQGLGYPNVAAWKGDPVAPPDWIVDWSKLWQIELADWYAQPHEMIVGMPLKPSKAIQVNPGTIVLITNAWPATRTGEYGVINRVGRVLRVRRNLLDATAEIDVLLQAGDANTRRRFAPIAVVLDDVATVEDRYNAATKTFACYANYFGTEDANQADVRYFAEPAWSNVGGDALVYGYQYDGRTWVQTFSFEVDTVDTTANTITHKGALAGTFYDRMFTVLTLAPYNVQTADWPKALFVVHTLADGTHNGSPGFKFVDKL